MEILINVFANVQYKDKIEIVHSHETWAKYNWTTFKDHWSRVTDHAYPINRYRILYIFVNNIGLSSTHIPSLRMFGRYHAHLSLERTRLIKIINKVRKTQSDEPTYLYRLILLPN